MKKKNCGAFAEMKELFPLFFCFPPFFHFFVSIFFSFLSFPFDLRSHHQIENEKRTIHVKHHNKLHGVVVIHHDYAYVSNAHIFFPYVTMVLHRWMFSFATALFVTSLFA